jgi:Na+/proline symporter
VLLVGVAAPLIAGIYWKKANTAGAVAGAFGGTASWILFSIFLPAGYPANLFGFAVSCFLTAAVSLKTVKTF